VYITDPLLLDGYWRVIIHEHCYFWFLFNWTLFQNYLDNLELPKIHFRKNLWG